MGRTGGAPLEARDVLRPKASKKTETSVLESQRIREFERGPQAPRTFAALDNTWISTYEILSRTARRAGPGLLTHGTVRS